MKVHILPDHLLGVDWQTMAQTARHRKNERNKIPLNVEQLRFPSASHQFCHSIQVCVYRTESV